MRRRLFIALALVLLAGMSYFALNSGVIKLPIDIPLLGHTEATAQPGTTGQGQGAGRRGERGPAPVEVAEAQEAVSATEILAIGSLMSDESVEVTSEASGRVEHIQFEEGKRVKAGDVLVRLDPSLTQAELKDAEARLELAQANFERNQSLRKTGAVAEQAYQEARTNLEVARAAVELARTRAAMMEVKAPFDGILGFRTVSVGAYVTAGTKLVNLEKIDQLKVEFSVPEVFLTQVSPGQKVEVTVDAWPGVTYEGTVYAINPHIDVNGRALQVRATLINNDLRLRPGLLARVIVKGKDEKRVVTVPESAVVLRGGETLIYRLENGRAIETQVTIGRRRNGQVEIIEGLAPKTQVVTAGHARLRNGSEVEIVTPAASVGG
jgi:membrane fusion protein, multidrug efflux system